MECVTSVCLMCHTLFSDFIVTFATMNHDIPKKSGVAVYCASSSEISPVFIDVARRMGALLASSSIPLVCGGGAGGMMAAAIEGAVDAGGVAVGVLPHFMMEKRWNHPRLTVCIDTESMHVRKQTMASLSRVAVALPGGIGTLDELAEIMTWHQLGLFTGPVVIVNTDGYYDLLVSLFDSMRDKGFMRGGNIPATIVRTPEEAMEIIRNEFQDRIG